MNNSKNKTTLIISGVVIAAIIIVAAWQLSDSKNEDIASTPTEMTDTEDQMAADDSNMESGDDSDQDSEDENDGDSVYADGEYTAIGNYISPAGEEEVEISITLEDDIVVAADFAGNATNPASIRLQGQFAEGFEEEVVGKSIDDISLTVVNGSSLTPKGFNEALDKIKEEAEI